MNTYVGRYTTLMRVNRHDHGPTHKRVKEPPKIQSLKKKTWRAANMGDAAAADSEYQKGSIRRIKLVNFMSARAPPRSKRC